VFRKEDILAQIRRVDELEQRINVGDIGHLKMADDEDDAVSQAEAILKEIKENLGSHTGFTHAQLIVMADSIVKDVNAERAESGGDVVVRRDDLLKNADSIIASVNKQLDDDARSEECLLTGMLDAIGYWKAALLYADAGMADEARKCIAGARYWLPRILERGAK